MSETSIKALMLIGTLFAYIKPEESTAKINKIKKATRKGLQSLFRSNPAEYSRISKEADTIWEAAKKEIANEHYTVSITATCREVFYSMMEVPEFESLVKRKKLWFTQKRFDDALESMEGVSTQPDDFAVERDSDRLASLFVTGLGIEKEHKAALRKIVAQEKARKALIEKEKEMIA